MDIALFYMDYGRPETARGWCHLKHFPEDVANEVVTSLPLSAWIPAREDTYDLFYPDVSTCVVCHLLVAFFLFFFFHLELSSKPDMILK